MWFILPYRQAALNWNCMIIMPSLGWISNYNSTEMRKKRVNRIDGKLFQECIFFGIIHQKGRHAHVFRQLPVYQRASGCGWPHAAIHATLADLFLFDKPWPSWTEPKVRGFRNSPLQQFIEPAKLWKMLRRAQENEPLLRTHPSASP